MHIIHVHVQVKAGQIDAFKAAILENAQSSVQEPGIMRFDVIQQRDDPTRFILIEIYRTPEDQARHRETPHYLKWREAVAEMMATPRAATQYTDVFMEGFKPESP